MIYFKTIIAIAIFFISFASPYCEGFEKGYAEGYCYERVGCVSPVSPVCPVPSPGFSSWRDGYNRGFSQGLKDRDNGKIN